MTTTIDFDALQVSEGPRVTLLANQEVGGGLVGDDFADFSAFASLSVDVKVQRLSSTSPPPLLTLLVEHSDDGLSWSTAETFTFTDDGEQTASLASPKAHVRASASGSGAEWYVKSVNVAPISGGGGGSLPSQWTVDPVSGQFILGYVPQGAIPPAAYIIGYVGDPTDYVPLFSVGDEPGGPKQVYHIDSSGDTDHYFRDSGVSLKYHRDHDGDNKELVKIGESVFNVSNTAHETSILEVVYDDDYLQVGAATSTLGFFTGAGAVKQTGVAVSAAGIHAALVAYGLIAA